MIVVIGSVAMNYGDRKGIHRRPKDIDLIVDAEGLKEIQNLFPESELKEGKTAGYYRLSPDPKYAISDLEIDAMDTESNRMLMAMDNLEPWSTWDGRVTFMVPSISTLAAIKQSHIRSPHGARKTFSDWKVFREHLKENPYTEADMAFLAQRTIETEERLSDVRNKVNLNTSNEKFFRNSQAIRKLEHDDVHRIVAFNDIPVFEMVKRDMAKAAVSKEMFAELPFKTKCQMVLEESFVIGYERFGETTKNPKRVYDSGFAYFSTKLCKGWFQDFIFENLDYFIDYQPEFDFIKKIDNFLEEEINGK